MCFLCGFLVVGNYKKTKPICQQVWLNMKDQGERTSLEENNAKAVKSIDAKL